MTYKVRAYAAHSPTTPLGPYRFDRRSPRADDGDQGHPQRRRAGVTFFDTAEG